MPCYGYCNCKVFCMFNFYLQQSVMVVAGEAFVDLDLLLPTFPLKQDTTMCYIMDTYGLDHPEALPTPHPQQSALRLETPLFNITLKSSSHKVINHKRRVPRHRGAFWIRRSKLITKAAAAVACMRLETFSLDKTFETVISTNIITESEN